MREGEGAAVQSLYSFVEEESQPYGSLLRANGFVAAAVDRFPGANTAQAPNPGSGGLGMVLAAFRQPVAQKHFFGGIEVL